jgi:MFS family permease
MLGCISLVWVLMWVTYFRDVPADHRGITREELDQLPNRGRAARAPADRLAVPWSRLAWRMLPVTVVYFCYGWTLWLYLNWLPSFFLHEYNLEIARSALFSSAVFSAGVGGDFLGGVLSDSILRRTGNVRMARRNVIVAGFVASGLFLLPIFITRDLTVIVLSLAAAFFCAELVIGPMWSIPMDIAPKFSGTASGFMNTGSAVAAVLSPMAFGWVADLTGDWHIPFIGSIGLLIAGAALAFTMHPERPFEEVADFRLQTADLH